jgi:hypothetical protein
VREYSQGLSGAAFANRLPNGNTLITDSSHSRVLEVTPNKKVVFEYFTNTNPASNSARCRPTRCNWWMGPSSSPISFIHRILIVNPKMQLQYGTVHVTGNGTNQLNWPYTAHVIGDYTGQTPPPATF